MKNRAKTIANIIKKHPEPTWDTIPKIILRWITKKEGFIYHDFSTGKRLSGNDVSSLVYDYENPLRPTLRRSGGVAFSGYIAFYEKERVVELSYIQLKLTHLKEGEIGKWEFVNSPHGTRRAFIFIDEYPHCIYDEDGNLCIIKEIHERLAKTSNGQGSILYSQITKRKSTGVGYLDFMAFESFLKAQRAPHTEEQLTDKEKLIREGNKLLEQCSTDHEAGISEAIVHNFPTMSILEVFASWGKNSRLYYNGKNYAISTIIDWNKSMPVSSMGDVPIINPEELQNGFFKYYADLFGKPNPVTTEWGYRGWTMRGQDNSKTCSSKLLIAMIRVPIIEQLVKAYGIHSCDNIYNTKGLEYYYGKINSKGKTITEKLNINKYQLNKVADFKQRSRIASYESPLIANFKIIFGESLRAIDNQTTDWFFENYMDFSALSYYLTVINPDREEFIKTMITRIRMSENRQELIGLLVDTIRTYESLTFPKPELASCSANELPHLHDVFVRLLNQQNAERQAIWEAELILNQQNAERQAIWEAKLIAKINKKRIETRQGFEYEDDKYVIRLPKDQSEIVREGMELHHCVGGYANSQEKGESTILFLRKKSEPDKPFYTIEVNIAVHEDGSTSSSIVQIHGFGNCWIGNNPEAIPTVIKWLRKNNIQCNDKILTSTSKSYPMGNNFVKMPEVA